MVTTGVGTLVATVTVLGVAPHLGPAWVGFGGIVFLGVMTTALIAGWYHTYRNAGVVSSLLPTVGVVLGVGVARWIRSTAGFDNASTGLGAVDVAVLLGGLAVVGCGLAYVVGLVWNR